jgi:hypothetical protein
LSVSFPCVIVSRVCSPLPCLCACLCPTPGEAEGTGTPATHRMFFGSDRFEMMAALYKLPYPGVFHPGGGKL